MFMIGEVAFVQGDNSITAGGALMLQGVNGRAPGLQKIRRTPNGSADNQGGGFAGGGIAQEMEPDPWEAEMFQERSSQRSRQRENQEWIAQSKFGDSLIPIFEF